MQQYHAPRKSKFMHKIQHKNNNYKTNEQGVFHKELNLIYNRI